MQFCSGSNFIDFFLDSPRVFLKIFPLLDFKELRVLEKGVLEQKLFEIYLSTKPEILLMVQFEKSIPTREPKTAM